MKKRYKLTLVTLIFALSLTLSGCSLFATAGSLAGKDEKELSDINSLKTGKLYVWHDKEGKTIEDDIRKAPSYPVFFEAPVGKISFEDEELTDAPMFPRAIWINDSDDEEIPTVGPGDLVLYVSETLVPDTFTFERFSDWGYTIGVANLTPDEGGHYFLTYQDTDDNDYIHYIDMASDAAEVAGFSGLSKLYLDQVGDIKVREDTVTAGGTVKGLEVGKTYRASFYTGTYFQDFKLKSDIRTFTSLETVKSHEYEFLHCNCIAITMPEYLKSGYYFINGLGLIRFVAEGDAGKYSGESYDASIDWNDPMIIRDENGFVVYDPSDPDAETKFSDAGADPEEEEKDTEPKEKAGEEVITDESSD